MAVDPAGTYYAVWTGDKIQILSERSSATFTSDDYNPYDAEWFAHPGKVEEMLVPVSWELIATRKNDSNAQMAFKVTHVNGLKKHTSTTKTITVTDKVSTTLSLGTKLTIKAAEISGSVQYSTEHSVQNVQQSLTEHEIFENHTEEMGFTLANGESLAVWQAFVNGWGNKIGLNHIAYRTFDDKPPSSTLTAKVQVMVFSKPLL
jgi:hypothetical protein